MHLSPWITSVTLFSTSALAFYPWKESSAKKSVTSKNHDRRFFPWPAGNEGEEEQEKVVTVDIKKRRSPVKRNNDFPVVLADAPNSKNAVAVNEDGSDYSYFATLAFGSSAQPMWMLMDTGAANTWVMGSDCTSTPCTSHDTFGAADSKTLDTTSQTWSVTYGTGDVSGVIASDTVAFADFSINLGFGLASNASDDFDDYPFDGILGLGRPDSDDMGTQTVMEVLAAQKLLDSNIIGVHLQRNEDGERDGQITFGGVDTTQYDGSLTYSSTTADNGLWEIPVDGCGFNGKSTGLTDRTAIIDTGTSYILMPEDDATALHEQFSSYTQNGEYYLIPCDSTEPVQFTFGGVTYDVSPKDYVGTKSGSSCTSNIIGHAAFGNTTWLLGDVFLKNVYTVFDFDEDRVGFGVKSSSSATSAAPVASVVPESVKSEQATATAVSSSGSSSSSASKTSSGSSTKATSSSSSSSSSSDDSPSSSSSSSSGSKTGKGSSSTASSSSSSSSTSTSSSTGNANASSLGSGASTVSLSVGMICSWTMVLILLGTVV